jgi:hypothetical protein
MRWIVDLHRRRRARAFDGKLLKAGAGEHPDRF